MVLADGLSRVPSTIESHEIPLDLKVCFVQFSSNKLEALREATRKDTKLHRLMEYIFEGFPEKQRDLHNDMKPYWSFRDELSVENGLILKGERIIVPQAMQQEYLNAIHTGHQGIVRCQQRAKSSIYWPGINNDIETMITACPMCQKHQPSQRKEKLENVVSDVPCVPWNTISSDLFTFEGRNFLIIADCYTKYPVIEELTSLSSKSIAKHTMKVFSLFGIPSTMISDNGPQFIGKEYQSLMKQHGIAHITSSPHHPQGHGFIERMIRTVKGFLHKSNLEEGLMSYRATPIDKEGSSPAELMFNREIQTNLPVYIKANERNNNKNKPQTNTRELPELKMNQQVFHQDVAKRTWSHGVVVGIGPAPRSYTIRCCDTGRLLCRNRVLLRPRSVMFNEYCQASTLDNDLEPPEMHQLNNPAQPSLKENKPMSSNSAPSIPAKEPDTATTPKTINQQPQAQRSTNQTPQQKTTQVPSHQHNKSSPQPSRKVTKPTEMNSNSEPVKTRSGRIINKPTRYR